MLSLVFQLLLAAPRKVAPPPPPPPSALLQFSGFCFSLNAACCFLSATALILQPNKAFTNQARRYSQLCGFGFLCIGLVSLYLRDPIGALVVCIYNAAFALLTWPMRIPGPPEINPAEKFFVVLAVICTAGILPAVFP